jgi:hypothetical protein
MWQRGGELYRATLMHMHQDQRFFSTTSEHNKASLSGYAKKVHHGGIILTSNAASS